MILAIDPGNTESGWCVMGEDYKPVRFGNPRPRERNAECRKQICAECGISESTFYTWLGQITEIVSYHAARRRLI